MIFPQEFTLLVGWIWDFFSAWWWLIAPLVLVPATNELWIMMKKREYMFTQMDWILVEVRLPQVVDRTAQAMEQVFSGLHGMYSRVKWFEKYRDGKVSPWFSCEIVSLGGETHFYLRILEKHRNLVEANIWAQYPDAEIHEVDDYTHSVPRQIPNEEWNLWGGEMKLSKPDPYPIRTYEEFESPVEERRLDPLASLLEIMGSLQPGEQLWFQILAQPVFGKWREDGRREVDKLMGKPVPKKKTILDIFAPAELVDFIRDFIVDIVDILLPFGGAETEAAPKREEKRDEGKSFMMLSQGERDTIEAIERNVGKLGYNVNIRFAYIGRKEVFTKNRISEFFGAMRQFNSEMLNSVVPNIETLPDLEMKPFAKERNYRRKRLLDRHIRYRFFRKRVFTFNTEELATMFHFPGMLVAKAPSVARIDAKRGEPPQTLPTA